jgi:hypothetical protein
VKGRMMAQFNLQDYETVEERHARAIALHPDLRCVLVNHSTPQDRLASTWVVEARVYLNAEDQALDLPKAVEWAFEVDGAGMANKTSALENANTSALGRALRWALGGSKGPSREEMMKAKAGVTPTVDWLAHAESLTDVDALRLLWTEAKASKAPQHILEKVKARAEQLDSDSGVSEGTGAGVPAGVRGKKTQ